jgi:chitodextrinase
MEQASAATVTRGPYLQMATSSGIVVRWRTDEATDSVVRYGDAPSNLTFSASSGTLNMEHEVAVTGLLPDTRYYYSVGSSGETLSGGDTGHFFATAPTPGLAKATRVWVIGDSGTANANAAAVRDAYKSYTGSTVTDLWLMLGDNAYPDGTQDQYQAAVFDTYPELLRKVVLWPTLGNHDGHTADSATQSGAYYEIFTLPTNGEAGGLATGTEAYYSFDYGNIHFVCLESYETDRSPSGAMMSWLENDLAANDKDWTIAFWHHPPYSKGSHNSDTESRLIEMREYALPILESYGVDIVLSGHSHSYERSHLLDQHYGTSGTLTSAMIIDGGGGREDGPGAYQKAEGGAPNEGAVYAVAGSSGKVSGGSLDHPAMFISLNSLGSMVLDITGNRLDAIFLDAGGSTGDYFTVVKGPDTTAPSLLLAQADDAWTVSVTFSEVLDEASAETATNYTIDNGVSVTLATLAADGKSVVLDTSPLVEGVTHTLTVNNVADLAGNPIAANSQTQFTFVTVYTKEFQDGVAPTSGYSGTRDAYISENAPDSAFGGATVLLVDGDDPSGTGRDLSTLLLWDLSDIPSGALVEGTTITINVTNVSSGSYELYEVKANWQEDSADWNSYAAGSPWEVPGASGASDRGTTVLGTVNGSSLGSRTLTLNQNGLNLIQGWVDGSAPNFGFIIADGQVSNGLDFGSREVSAPLDRPKLTVTYSLPPAGPDVEPPSPPSDLQLVSKTESAVSLSWQPCAGYPVQSCDNVGVAGHKVYRDSQIVGTTTATSYVDSGLSPATSYDYEISSYDAADNESLGNPLLQVTTDAADPPVVLVNDVAMGLRNAGKKWRNATAQVTIVDGDAAGVANATVTGAWSGLTNESVSDVTGAGGVVTFNSAKVPKNQSGEFAFAVTDVVAAGYGYDPASNVESGDCITSDGSACGGDPGGESYTMQVSALSVAVIPSRKHWRGQASVTVVDIGGTGTPPVSDAMVTGAWQLQKAGGAVVDLDSASGVTDADGLALILSPKQRAGSEDRFLFQVTGVTRPGSDYDPGGVTSGSAIVP